MAILLTLNQLKIWPTWGWWIVPLLLAFFETYIFLKESEIFWEDSFNYIDEKNDNIFNLLTYTSMVPELSDDVKIVDIEKLIIKKEKKNDKEKMKYTYHDCLVGNFICYLMLMGYISIFNEWILIIICYISMIVGILLTKQFQDLYKNSLPDLAGPTIFCLSMLFLTREFISPFILQLFKYLSGRIYFS